jgi:3-phenylpropionate/cinnamic acid dioxygenase small subunit
MTTEREEITDLLYTYAERIDLGDFDGVSELFAHAEISYEGFEQSRRGSAEVLDSYVTTTRRYDDGTPKTKHLMTNVIVEVGPGAIATSRSYFTVLQAVPGALSLQPVIAGRYHSRFEKTAGVWRFTNMHIIVELFGDLAHHLLFDLAKEASA